MTRRWSPTRAGLVAVLATCVVGIALAVVATQSIADPGARGARSRRYGSYAGIAAAVLGATTYAAQAWRR